MKSTACFAEEMLTERDTQAPCYPIALDLEYYVMDRGCIVATGTGKTTRISTSVIVFEPAADLAPGTVLQIIARWPVLYRGKEVLKWIVQGRIAGPTAGGMALMIEHEHLARSGNGDTTA
jgi:hypothetical protein